jgi:hypothetical protein
MANVSLCFHETFLDFETFFNQWIECLLGIPKLSLHQNFIHLFSIP